MQTVRFGTVLLVFILSCGTKEQNQLPTDTSPPTTDSVMLATKKKSDFDRLERLIVEKKDSILFLCFWNGMSEELFLNVAEMKKEKGELGYFQEVAVAEPGWRPKTQMFYYEFTVANDGSVESFSPIGQGDLITFNMRIMPYFVDSKLKAISLYNPHYRYPDAPLNQENKTFHDNSDFAIKYRKIESYFSEKMMNMYKEKYGPSKPTWDSIDKEFKLQWTRSKDYVSFVFTNIYGYTSLKCISYSDKATQDTMRKDELQRKDSINRIHKKVI